MRPKRWWALVAALAFATPLAAQNVDVSGQVRPRYEFRDPVDGGRDEFTSMRVRVGFDAEVDRNLSVFVQMQDVRLLGEETHPLFDYSADNLDLHQAYLRYRGEELDWLTATVGRMETNFGGERLVGAVGWTQQGQSFDGARFDGDAEWGNVSLVAYKLGDATAASVASDSELYGAYATVDDAGPGALDLYWLYDRARAATETDEQTLGVRYAFSGDVNGRFESSLQTGTRADSDVSAYMFGARLGKAFAGGRGRITLWYDYLSGDDPATPDLEVFQTSHGTNHKFYGLADLFLNIPAHTGGAGLKDMAVKLNWQDGRYGFAADLHSFSAAEQGSLADSHFGNEVDLSLTHRHSDHLTAVAGFSFVVQDDGFSEIGRLSEDMTWFYLMLNATF